MKIMKFVFEFNFMVLMFCSIVKIFVVVIVFLYIIDWINVVIEFVVIFVVVNFICVSLN